MAKDLSSDVKNDFFKKESTTASTSKYIQTNVPSTTGEYKERKQTGTPDDAFLTPNLKKEEVKTVKFDENVLTKILGIPLPFVKTTNTQKIEEVKPSSEKGEYGKVRVQETKGGFVELKDETEGHKIWTHIHPSGTYDTIVDNGDQTEKTVNDRYIIVDKNWYITVGEDEVVLISGNNKVQIKKDRQINITGDDNLNIEGNSNTKIKGNKGTEVSGSIFEKVSGEKGINIGGSKTEKVASDSKLEVSGNETNMVAKNQTDIIGGNLIITVGGNVLLSASGVMNITSSSKVNITAPMVSLN